MSWHISNTVLDAYVTDDLDDADAWSVEAHLVACEPCRRRLTAITGDSAPEVAAVVAQARAALSTDLPAQGRVRPATELRRVRLLCLSGPAARGPWLLATVVLMAVGLLLDLAGVRPGLAELGPVWLTVLAPVIPVMGVAAAYSHSLDDAFEVIASAPGGGMRLLLWRTLTVLAITIGVLVGWGLIVPDLTAAGAGAALLPALALTVLTLALGSAVGMPVAAAVVLGGWTAVIVAPVLIASGSPLLWVDSVTATGWVLITAMAAAVVAVRHHDFARHALRAGTRTETS